MPAIREANWASNTTSNSTEPQTGVTVSVDSSANGKNIIAMIIATVLFIVMVVFYQYLSFVLAKREEDARAKRAPRPTIFTLLGELLSKVKRQTIRLASMLFSLLKRFIPHRANDDFDFSCRGSMVGLLRPSQRKEQSYLPKLPCGGSRVGGYKQKALERGTLRPLLLRKENSQNSPLSPLSPMSPMSPRTPIDLETQAYLRSPTAFEFDDQNMKGSHRRSKHVWSARLQAGQSVIGGYPTPPLIIRKKSDGYSLIEYKGGHSSSVQSRYSYRSPYDLDSPSKPCTREEADSSPTYSSFPPTPTTPYTPRDDTSSLYTISEEQDVVVIKPGEEDHRGYIRSYELSLPANAKKKDEVFVIGDPSESDFYTDGSGH